MSEYNPRAQAPINNLNDSDDFNAFPEGSFGVTHAEGNAPTDRQSPSYPGHIVPSGWPGEHHMNDKVVNPLPSDLSTQHLDDLAGKAAFVENPNFTPQSAPESASHDTAIKAAYAEGEKKGKKKGFRNGYGLYLGAGALITAGLVAYSGGDISKLSINGDSNEKPSNNSISSIDDVSDEDYNPVRQNPETGERTVRLTATTPAPVETTPKSAVEEEVDKFLKLSREQQMDYGLETVESLRESSYKRLFPGRDSVQYPSESDSAEVYAQKAHDILSADFYTASDAGYSSGVEGAKLFAVIINPKEASEYYETITDQVGIGKDWLDHRGVVSNALVANTASGHRAVAYDRINDKGQSIRMNLMIEGDDSDSTPTFTIQQAT